MHITNRATTEAAFAPSLFAPKLYYFSYYAALAFLMPFLVLYYRQVGLSSAQIGLLTGLAPVVTLLAAPLWGAIADAGRLHRRLLVAATIGTTIMVALLSQARGLGWMLPVVVGYAFFAAPIMPLVDNSVMALLGKDAASYGRQRLWGAVGWGLAGSGAGVIVERTGLSAIFVGYIAFMLIGLLAARRFAIQPAAIGQPFWVGVRTLIRNRTLAIFLITVLIAGMGTTLVHTYLFLYLADLGASATLMGLSLTMATVSEIVVFFFSAWLLRKLGARGLLLVAMAAYVVRMVGYGWMAAAWWVLPLNLFHGLTFAMMWVAGVSYANEVAPPGMGATAQGLFAGTTMGLGAALGASIAGVLYDEIGPAMLYRVGALWLAVGLIFFWVASRRTVTPTTTAGGHTASG